MFSVEDKMVSLMKQSLAMQGYRDIAEQARQYNNFLLNGTPAMPGVSNHGVGAVFSIDDDAAWHWRYNIPKRVHVYPVTEYEQKLIDLHNTLMDWLHSYQYVFNNPCSLDGIWNDNEDTDDMFNSLIEKLCYEADEDEYDYIDWVIKQLDNIYYDEIAFLSITEEYEFDLPVHMLRILYPAELNRTDFMVMMKEKFYL